MQLLDLLEEIVLAEGGLRFTMSQLAQKLRCSKRTLYQIAPSKEDLFLLVLKKNLDRIWRLGLQAEKSSTSKQAQINDYVLIALVEVRQWSDAFLGDIHSLQEARRMLDEHLDERMRYLVHMIQEGIDSGEFQDRNPIVVAEMLHVSAMAFTSPHFLERAGMSLSQAVEEMCVIVSHGLISKEPGSLGEEDRNEGLSIAAGQRGGQ